MNENLIQKIEYPGESEIYGYKDFNAELMSIVKNSGNQKEIARDMFRFFGFMEDGGRKVLIHAFLEKKKSDYKIAIKKSEGIVDRLQGGE